MCTPLTRRTATRLVPVYRARTLDAPPPPGVPCDVIGTVRGGSGVAQRVCVHAHPFRLSFLFLHVARSPRRYGFFQLSILFSDSIATVRFDEHCLVHWLLWPSQLHVLRDSRVDGCPGSVRLLYVTCCHAMSPAASFFVPGTTFEQVWSVAYSPAGDKLVSGCDDGVLQVFERA